MKGWTSSGSTLNGRLEASREHPWNSMWAEHTSTRVYEETGLRLRELVVVPDGQP